MILGLIGLTPAQASANERHFTYTYETATLPAGAFELEPWVTVRTGHQQYFNAIDYTLEFEGGVTDNLQTAIYINGTTSADGSGGPSVPYATSSGASVSNEWKLRLLDRETRPIGLALYGEVLVGAANLEIEGKVLLDRWFGNLLVAVNLIAEDEWVFNSMGETGRQIEFEVDAAAAYRVAPRVTVGLEVRNWNRWTLNDESLFADSVLYAGPTVAVSLRSFWVAASVLPQVHAFAGPSDASGRNLTTQEAVNARILLGVHL